MSNTNDTEARVERGPDGTLVLVDPVAAATIAAVAQHNLFELNRERVEHFARRIVERGGDTRRLCITLLDVDDRLGALFAEMLMPGYDWQAIRDRGERPVARGLADRERLLEIANGATPGVLAEAEALPAGHATVVIIAGGRAGVRGVPLPRVQP